MAGKSGVTMQTLRVLAVMLEEPTEPRYGLQLSGATGLKSGTLYPILARLEAAGWVESDWETQAAAALGRPRRRYYRLTGVGAEAAQAEVQQVTAIWAATTRRLLPVVGSLRPAGGGVT